MASMTEYYGRMKSGIGSIDPKDMAQLGEDYMIVAASGLAVGLISGAIGGLDKKIAGFTVPIDGIISLGLGMAGLQMRGDSGKALKIASIAIGGSASVRTFERFFKGAFGVHGEFNELPGHQAPKQLGAGFGRGFGFGMSAQDRLVHASRFL
jgi:hypothetical protein